MAKLARVVKDLETVEEPYRGLYVESTKYPGEYVLDLEGEDNDTRTLKVLLESTKKELKRVKDRIKALPEDVDPEELASLLEQRQQLEEEKAKGSGEFEKLKAQIVDKAAKEQQKLREVLSKKDAFIARLLVDNAASQAISEVGGSVRLLLPHVRQHIRVVEDEVTGEPVAQVVDSKGTARIGSSAGEPMSISEFVSELKGSDEFAPAFRGAGSTGSGTPPGGGTSAGSAGMVTSLHDLKTDADKASFISKNGFEAYQELVARAHAPS